MPTVQQTTQTPSRTFLYAISKHLTNPFGEGTDIAIKPITDPTIPSPELANEWKTKAYLLSCTNLWSSHRCVINTPAQDRALAVFNRAVNELERDRDYTPYRIVDWLVNGGEFNDVCIPLSKERVIDVVEYVNQKRKMFASCGIVVDSDFNFIKERGNESPSKNIEPVTIRFNDYYSSTGKPTTVRYIDEIFSTGSINDRQFALTIRGFPSGYLSYEQFENFYNLPVSKDDTGWYFINLQEFSGNRSVAGEALLLKCSNKPAIEFVSEQILENIQTSFRTKSGTLAECTNWLKNSAVGCYPLLSVKPKHNSNFIFSSRETLDLPQDASLGDRQAEINLRAVKDPMVNNPVSAKQSKVGGYLLSWRENNIYPTQVVVINTANSALANEVLTEAKRKLNENVYKPTPLELMHWLVWCSKYSQMTGSDGNKLLRWHPSL